MEKKDKCCTPKGQVPRYVDCIGCDKKPIETMSKQTAVNVLKQHIQDAIEKTVVDNHYESGYKQCLIDIQNKIDDGLLQMEKEQIVKSYRGGAEWQRQQQAFRWFREKHNIDAWVQPFVCEKQNGKPFLPDESYVYYIFKDGVYVDDAVNFLNYEEAELACLQKLIEIVKTK